MNATCASEVLNLLREEISVFAAWDRLAGFKCEEVAGHSYFPKFVKLSQSLLQKPGGLARAVANMCWAAARIHGCNSSQLAALWQPLAFATRQTVGSMNAQDVANVIWATGQLSLDPSSKQDLREALPVVVERARLVLPQTTPQALANCCWGLAFSDYCDDVFLEAAAKKVATDAAGWKPAGCRLDLPSVLWAFARLSATGYSDMLHVAAERLSSMLDRLGDWGRCAVAWSYKQLDASSNFLAFRSLESEIEFRQLSEEDVQRSSMGPEKW